MGGEKETGWANHRLRRCCGSGWVKLLDQVQRGGLATVIRGAKSSFDF